VSTNFALANFLASSSLRNVSVALACFRFPRGSSNETYHVPWDLLAMMRRSRGYAGGDKPKLLGILHIASVTSGTSIEGDRIRSAQHPILAVCWTSGLVFRGGRIGQPSGQRRTSGVSGVTGAAAEPAITSNYRNLESRVGASIVCCRQGLPAGPALGGLF
jgi:hypothetical protein